MPRNRRRCLCCSIGGNGGQLTCPGLLNCHRNRAIQIKNDHKSRRDLKLIVIQADTNHVTGSNCTDHILKIKIMTPISGVSASATTAVSAAVSQQSIASLQAQMVRYAPAAGSQNSRASADYKALQQAIQSNNVSDAQAALARLQRDSQTATHGTTTQSPASTPVDSDGDHNGSAPGRPWNSVNVTA
jgi:hypothetical protein